MNNKEKAIRDYVATQLLGVLSTITPDNKPTAALVGITETDSLDLIFGTSNTSRKYKNVQTNPHVAIVIGHDVEAATTVQYEGVARQLEGEELAAAREAHFTKNPRARKFANNPDQVFFTVSPTWIRYTNFSARPPEQFELTF